MAFAATGIWEVRPTASDLNAGYFNPARGGTDYSQQGAAQMSLSDVVTATTTTVTSATGGFTAAMIGNGFNVAGTVYEIVAVGSSTSVTVDRATGSGSGQAGRVGGAVATPGYASGQLAAGSGGGNVIWITGSFTVTTAAVNASGGPVSLTQAGTAAATMTRLLGYAVTRGDNPTGATRPIITLGTGLAPAAVVSMSAYSQYVSNVVVDCNNQSGVIGIKGNNQNHAAYQCLVRNWTGNTAGFSTLNNAVDCEGSCQSSGLGGSFSAIASVVNCYAHGGGGGFLNCVSHESCVAYSVGGTFQGYLGGQNSNFTRCIAYGYPVGFSNTQGGRVTVTRNCIAWGSTSGAGFSIDQSAILSGCAGGGNVGGNVSGTPLANVGFASLTVDPFTSAATGNFALNTVAGGGAACRSAGFAQVPGTAAVGFPDVGTLQHQDAGGGSPRIAVRVGPQWIAPLGNIRATAVITSPTGSPVASDAAPTFTIYRNGVADAGVTVTPTLIVTGQYALAATLSASYVTGNAVSVGVLATVGGVSVADLSDSATVMAGPTTVLPAFAANTTGGLLTVGTAAGQLNPDGTGAVKLSATDNAATAVNTLLNAVVHGTATVAASPAPTTTTFALTGFSSTDFYRGSILVWTTGPQGAATNAGSSAAMVTAFNTANQTVTLATPLPLAPVAGDAMLVLNGPRVAGLFYGHLNADGSVRATDAGGNAIGTAAGQAALPAAVWSDAATYAAGTKAAVVAALYTLLQTVSTTDAQTLADAAAELSTGATAVQLAAVLSNVQTLVGKLPAGGALIGDATAAAQTTLATAVTNVGTAVGAIATGATIVKATLAGANAGALTPAAFAAGVLPANFGSLVITAGQSLGNFAAGGAVVLSPADTTAITVAKLQFTNGTLVQTDQRALNGGPVVAAAAVVPVVVTPALGLTEADVQAATEAAVAAAVAAAGLAPSAGALPVTVTVTDAATGRPVQSATVRVTINATSYAAVANTSGVATFALDAGTYAVTATAGGYAGATVTAAVATAGQAVAVRLGALAPITPTSAAEVVGTLFAADDQGNPRPGAVYKFQLAKVGRLPFSVTAANDTSATLRATFVAGETYVGWDASQPRPLWEDLAPFTAGPGDFAIPLLLNEACALWPPSVGVP